MFSPVKRRNFPAWRSLNLTAPKELQGAEAVLHASVFRWLLSLAQEQSKCVLLALVAEEA